MKNTLTFLFAWTILFFQSSYSQDVFKLHSHNDYEQKVPFWTAYNAGCVSIEVDLFLEGDQLMVAHEKRSIDPKRTLQSLYLDPISQGLSVGLIDSIGFHLMLDLKTSGVATLRRIVEVSEDYREMLYSSTNPKGLKFIISGNRPPVEEYTSYPEWVFFDYQSQELHESLPWQKIAMVSLSFRGFSVWNGKGRMVEEERQKLVRFIEKVQSFQKPVRFWASPDGKTAWKAFATMGVDYINTDHPQEAANYLSNFEKNTYQNSEFFQVYRPTYETDGASIPVQQVILMIGDGAGLAQISAGLLSNGGSLNLSQFKNIGLVKTQALDDFTTDSAAGATAYSTGEKTNNRHIGVGSQGEKLKNLSELLAPKGVSSGVVTTDQLTGATPASFYAHHHERDDSNALASFLAKSDLDIFIAGGKRDFEGNMTDLKQNGFQLVDQLQDVSKASSERVGFFAGEGSLPSIEEGRGDFLKEASTQALKFLSEKNHPFFLMIESAMIDSGGHRNSASMLVSELLDFDKAIGEVVKWVDEHPGTLLVVTADHETGGVSIPQGNIHQGEVELAFHSEDHTGILVPLFAYGAQAQLFQGVYENTEVFTKILEVLGKD